MCHARFDGMNVMCRPADGTTYTSKREQASVFSRGREPKQGSTLRDLAFFVLRVLAARVAELLDLELLGLRALVLVGDVVVALAVLTGELDEVSHLGGSSERVTVGGCAALKRKRQPSPLPEKVREV
jgi:hypothetical protein